ncbi:MAG: arsenic resistance N-acetyltransferase ArsN2 [Gemmatimonadota bacterium]
MSIQPLGDDELPGIIALLAANGLPTSDLIEGGAHFLGVHDGRGLEGIVAIQPYGAAALLRSLAVRADRRGSGLGSALVLEAERLAAARGIGALYLLTSDAGPFFASRGFRQVPREQAPAALRETPQFTSLCLASICMTKQLETGNGEAAG